jgi:uncharacterized membrane protein YphA (DoxX/SURF4 family)
VRSPCEHWRSFWNERGDSWPLSIFRILWASLQLEFAVTIARWTLLERSLPPLPYPGLSLLSELPVALTLLLAALHIVGSLLLLLGWHTRLVQLLLALTAFLLFFRSASTYQNHYALYLLCTLELTLASTERYYSLDARRMRSQLSPEAFRQWQEEPVALLPQRLLLLQASLLYFFAALSKLDPSWFARWTTTPEVLALTHSPPLRALWSVLLAHDLAWIPLVLTILLMLTLSIFLMTRHCPPLLLLMGAILHLSFDLHLPIMQFTPMMIAILFLALPTSMSLSPSSVFHRRDVQSSV